MTSDRYNFYRILGVQPGADEPEIRKAYEVLAASVQLEDMAPDKKKETALKLVAAAAGRQMLGDFEKRRLYDAKLDEAQKGESEKEKIQSRRAGKLQEEQSIEDDEKLKQVSLRVDAALETLADFYFEELFAEARKGELRSVSLEKLMEWIGAERSEALRAFEQKGRRLAFRIDSHGLMNIQEMRRKRSEEIGALVDGLVKSQSEEREHER